VHKVMWYYFVIIYLQLGTRVKLNHSEMVKYKGHFGFRYQ